MAVLEDESLQDTSLGLVPSRGCRGPCVSVHRDQEGYLPRGIRVLSQQEGAGVLRGPKPASAQHTQYCQPDPETQQVAWNTAHGGYRPHSHSRCHSHRQRISSSLSRGLLSHSHTGAPRLLPAALEILATCLLVTSYRKLTAPEHS